MSMPSSPQPLDDAVTTLQENSRDKEAKVSEKRQRLTRLGLIDRPAVKAAAVPGGGKVVTPALCPIALILRPAHQHSPVSHNVAGGSRGDIKVSKRRHA